MHQIQRKRAADYFAANGIDRALLCSPASVKWLTGFAAPVELGPNPFQGAPPIVWFDRGSWVLVLVEGLAGAASLFAAEPNCALLPYEGYTIQTDPAGPKHVIEALRSLRLPAGSSTAIEANALPTFIGLELGLDSVRAIDGWSDPLRVIKTEEELVKLRENFRLTDIGQEAARKAVQAGATEVDVFLASHAAIHRAAGERVPLGNDWVVGSRKSNIGGWPLRNMIRSHDSFIVDLSTLKHGYWSDSCATYYAGEPTPKQRDMHAVVSRALEIGKSLLRPGSIASNIDAAMRRVIIEAGYPEYPHHGGHGVGVTGHEAPRIVPYSQEVLEPGMVVMLEPGIYLPGESSVRIEDGMLITGSGCELLTNHDHRIP